MDHGPLTEPVPDSWSDAQFESHLEELLRGDIGLAHTGWPELATTLRRARIDAGLTPPDEVSGIEHDTELGGGHHEFEQLGRVLKLAQQRLGLVQLERARGVLEQIAYRRFNHASHRLAAAHKAENALEWAQIGAYIAATRRLRGMSVTRLATELGTTTQIITRIETGDTDPTERTELMTVSAAGLAWASRFDKHLSFVPESVTRSLDSFLHAERTRSGTTSPPAQKPAQEAETARGAVPVPQLPGAVDSEPELDATLQPTAEAVNTGTPTQAPGQRHIGEWLSEQLAGTGTTMTSLAAMMGVSTATVSRYANQQAPTPRHVLERAVPILQPGTTVEELRRSHPRGHSDTAQGRTAATRAPRTRRPGSVPPESPVASPGAAATSSSTTPHTEPTAPSPSHDDAAHVPVPPVHLPPPGDGSDADHDWQRLTSEIHARREASGDTVGLFALNHKLPRRVIALIDTGAVPRDLAGYHLLHRVLRVTGPEETTPELAEALGRIKTQLDQAYLAQLRSEPEPFQGWADSGLPELGLELLDGRLRADEPLAQLARRVGCGEDRVLTAEHGFVHLNHTDPHRSDVDVATDLMTTLRFSPADQVRHDSALTALRDSGAERTPPRDPAALSDSPHDASDYIADELAVSGDAIQARSTARLRGVPATAVAAATGHGFPEEPVQDPGGWRTFGWIHRLHRVIHGINEAAVAEPTQATVADVAAMERGEDGPVIGRATLAPRCCELASSRRIFESTKYFTVTDRYDTSRSGWSCTIQLARDLQKEGMLRELRVHGTMPTAAEFYERNGLDGDVIRPLTDGTLSTIGQEVEVLAFARAVAAEWNRAVENVKTAPPRRRHITHSPVVRRATSTAMPVPGRGGTGRIPPPHRGPR